ncbi:MAG: multicopper oxidase domain-containing protein [Flavobacteriales bacterium]|nr:multicopper oxidase domain-containing protein [Flavobacteriales bacterium]
MRKIVTLFVFGCMVVVGIAANVSETLYINRGEFMASDSSTFIYMAFNRTPTFDQENARLAAGIGDNLEIKVINNDSIVHGFDIKGYSGVSNMIQPGDSVTITCSFSSESVFIYYDNYNYPVYAYMGLGGMIVVSDNQHSKFYWNIKEHEKSFNDTIANGYAVDWQEYYPDYFTINGNSNPDINMDVNARVTGSIGDTIHIYMVNTGRSIHSIHYHGYHSEIIFSSKFPTHEGRLKDTFAVYPMEIVQLQLIPDQLGEYPVHDHNLVAVSGGNIYPNGMFLTILIQ